MDEVRGTGNPRVRYEGGESMGEVRGAGESKG